MTASTNSRRKVEVEDIPGPDFTTYCKEEPELETTSVETEASEPIEFSYDGSFAIHRKNGLEGETIKTGRGLACRAYARGYWSVTLRCDAPNTREQSAEHSENLKAELVKYAATIDSLKCKARDYLGYCPRGHNDYSQPLAPPEATDGVATRATTGDIFLNDIYPLSQQIYDILSLDPAGSPGGLIAITGATDSSKSLITRGLIFLFLEAAAKRSLAKGIRRPHLVTFEDPIEEYFIKNPTTDLAPANLDELTGLLTAFNLDYTPRQKQIDCDTLIRVIKDAKRQTPAVLFVGETRDPEDWKQLLDFGSSGHLVFTTSHSGSVMEAMSQILRDTKTETPSQRSEVARRIRGIVNIRSLTQAVTNQGGTPGSMRALLPAVWKSTSQSINNLVADGLSSILPALGRESEIGYYARTYFANALRQDPATTDRFKEIEKRQDVENDIVRKAMEWDIRGI